MRQHVMSSPKAYGQRQVARLRYMRISRLKKYLGLQRAAGFLYGMACVALLLLCPHVSYPEYIAYTGP